MTASTAYLPRRRFVVCLQQFSNAPCCRWGRMSAIFPGWDLHYIRKKKDRSSACVAAPTSRTFHYHDSRDNADIRTGRRRRLFELLRHPLLVDNQSRGAEQWSAISRAARVRAGNYADTSQLVTRSSRHTVNSSHSQLVTVNSSQC